MNCYAVNYVEMKYNSLLTFFFPRELHNDSSQLHTTVRSEHMWSVRFIPVPLLPLLQPGCFTCWQKIYYNYVCDHLGAPEEIKAFYVTKRGLILIYHSYVTLYVKHWVIIRLSTSFYE
jgi:hypothetical protein